MACRIAYRGVALGIIVPFLVAAVGGAAVWTQTDWSGGPGQLSWTDSTRYYSGTYVSGWMNPGDLRLALDIGNWKNTGEIFGATKIHSILEASDGALYAAGHSTLPECYVFKSLDAGTTWTETMGWLPAATEVHSIIEAPDGALYAGTEPLGNVFKSTDGGELWDLTGVLAGASIVYTVMQTSDGALYAGTYPDGNVFKSVDDGVTWFNTGDLAGAGQVRSIIEAHDGALYAATSGTGDVFKSVDAGTTWIATGELSGVTQVFSVVETHDNALYAASYDFSDTARVFRSIDAGTTWVTTGELAGAYRVSSIVEAWNGALFAGTAPNGDVFVSFDGGVIWYNTGDLSEAYDALSIMLSSKGLLYAGTMNGSGAVFRADCFATGELVSSVFETHIDVSYGIVTWDEMLNDQTINLLVRTDTLPDMSTAADWDTCPPAVNGQDISSLSSVDDGERYIQYRVDFFTSRPDVTPTLYEVVIEYDVPGVHEEYYSRALGTGAWLLDCQPNPLRHLALISYSLPAATEITLSIYDISGRLVETLVNDTQQSGIHQVRWNRKANPSGVYFYRLKACPERSGEPVEPRSRRAGEFVEAGKMVVAE